MSTDQLPRLDSTPARALADRVIGRWYETHDQYADFTIDSPEELVECLSFLSENVDAAARQTPTAVDLIAAEQLVQIHDTPATPDDLGTVRSCSALVAAAAAYMYAAPTCWPFDPEEFQPTDDPIHDLTKAGALIAAALDVHMAAQRRTENGCPR